MLMGGLIMKRQLEEKREFEKRWSIEGWHGMASHFLSQDHAMMDRQGLKCGID
jgi:hypothetical protein